MEKLNTQLDLNVGLRKRLGRKWLFRAVETKGGPGKKNTEGFMHREGHEHFHV